MPQYNGWMLGFWNYHMFVRRSLYTAEDTSIHCFNFWFHNYMAIEKSTFTLQKPLLQWIDTRVPKCAQPNPIKSILPPYNWWMLKMSIRFGSSIERWLAKNLGQFKSSCNIPNQTKYWYIMLNSEIIRIVWCSHLMAWNRPVHLGSWEIFGRLSCELKELKAIKTKRTPNNQV